ncbi:MAG: hypothetical protein Kow0022_04640 [Phycisphaerales bacterium]
MDQFTTDAPATRTDQPTPPQPTYREVTLAAMVFGVAFGLIMNAAITYAGLKIGFTIGGSAIAAVLGFGVLRGLLRRGSILETNIAQTVASAVNTSNSGVIFTVPVLLLFGYNLYWKRLDFWLITLACVAGAMLGTAFIVPLRKQMIDIERLRFPSATGVATILKSPGAGIKKTIVLLAGIVAGAAIYLPAGLPAIERAVPIEQIVYPTQRSLAELIAVDEQTRAEGHAPAGGRPQEALQSGSGIDRSTTPDLQAMDALDRLVFTERISVAEAQATRDAAGWVRAQAAPAEVIARARLVAQLRERTRELKDHIARLSVVPVDPALKPAIATLKQQIADLKAQLEQAPGGQYPDEMLLEVHRIVTEADTWDKLIDRRFGWVGDPLPGYADLEWRRPAYYDGKTHQLHSRVDYDGNGRPDLVVTDDRIDLGRMLDLPGQWQLIFAIAPFALGAGFITGRPGLMVLAGGILAYFVINPFVFQAGYLPLGTRSFEAPQVAFQLFNRPLGIGLLLGGALMGVLAAAPAIVAALKSIGAAKVGGRDELGLMPLGVAILGAVALLYLAADFVGNKPLNEGGLCPVSGLEVTHETEPAQFEGYLIRFASPQDKQTWETWSQADKEAVLERYHAKPGWLSGLSPHMRALIIAVVGCVWIWFTGIIIAQCTGMTDWSPISGMALLTVVLVLMLAGTGAVVGAVLIGAALCVAITLAADMMADLKTGYLVGAQPRRQQVAELCVVWIGPIVCMLTLVLIAQVNLRQTGVPIGPGTPTTAPQAQALQAVIEGVQGGAMPYALYAVGALLGMLLGLGSFAGLGVLVGLSMYLPFFYISTYGIGCIANIVLSAFKGRRFCEEWGVPFAAGLIVGESILALLINMVVLATG